MSRHVIIYWPDIRNDQVDWVVADDKGALVDDPQRGTLADAAAIIEGRRATLILPGNDVLLTETVVPGGSLARAQQAVPFALEDQVADDVDTLHFALGSKGRDDMYPVAVIGRATMDSVTEQCAAAGLRASEIIPETLALPASDGQGLHGEAWTAFVDADQAIVRLSGYRGFSTDTSMASMMLDGAAADLPEDTAVSLQVFRTDPASQLTVPDALDVELRDCEHRLGLYAIGLATAPRINLLQGSYNPKTHFDKAWKPWRWTAALAALLCLTLFAGKWLDLRQLNRQEAVLDQQIATAFEQALPGTRMRRPKRQIQQALDSVGKGDTDGFTNRFAQIAASLSTQPKTQLKTIGYRNGRFDLDLNTDAVPTLDALKSELSKRGSLTMTVQSANREKDSVRGRVRIE